MIRRRVEKSIQARQKKLVTKNYTFIFVDLVRTFVYIKNNLLRKDKIK